jgi:uncharacterized membrane protein
MISNPWFTSSHFVMLGLLLIFAIAHSGGAACRPWGEKLFGARLYRIFFALISLPLAVILITYFVNHRYDGWQLWQVQDVRGIRVVVGVLSAISFLFLYPATFNLLEIAAIQQPQIHLYETHTIWLGTSFTLITSIGLILHHIFGVWHGDRRWQDRYGAAFEVVKQRTSIMPFKAVITGHQSIKWREFLRPAYLGVAIFISLLWWAHPLLLIATSKIRWLA